MRNLAILIALTLTTNVSATGYPVYRMLRENTYRLDNGTGFVVRYKDSSYMITNWHVCRSYIHMNAENEALKMLEPTRVIKRFPDIDLCVMSTTRTDGLKLGKDVGEKAAVYVGGYPQYAKTLQLRSGHTLFLRDETVDYGLGYCPKSFEQTPTIDPSTKQTVTTCKNTQKIMDTDVEGTYGNSGSPVVNSRGEVVGVAHTTSFHEPQDDHHNTINYVPVSKLVEALDSL